MFVNIVTCILCPVDMAELKLYHKLLDNYVPVRPVREWTDTVYVRVQLHLFYLQDLVSHETPED